jgi:hypothetical protein
MTFSRTWIAFSLMVAAAGCGGGSSGDDTQVDARPGIDAPLPEGYTRLIGRSWSLQPGQTDTYKCVRITIPNDTYITSIMAQAPLGTHHTVLSIASGGAAGADGEQDCSVNTLGMVMLYASGVGTAPLDFPTDVGIRVSAGQQIHLNLHLYNTSDAVLAGESAILVKQSPTPPPILAENVFAGTFNIVIPGNSTRTVTGTCSASSNYSLFAVWPHMHQLATHQKVELVRGGTPTTLHDRAFNFAEQNYYLQSPEVQVQAGDQIRVSCTYVNNTPNTVTFGDSSNQEMCFAGLYRYPARGGSIFECSGG